MPPLFSSALSEAAHHPKEAAPHPQGPLASSVKPQVSHLEHRAVPLLPVPTELPLSRRRSSGLQAGGTEARGLRSSRTCPQLHPTLSPWG